MKYNADSSANENVGERQKSSWLKNETKFGLIYLQQVGCYNMFL